MSKRQLIILLGIWTAIFLFLGFPSNWDKAIGILTGLIVAVVAYKTKSTDGKIPYQGANITPKADITFIEHKTGGITNVNS